MTIHKVMDPMCHKVPKGELIYIYFFFSPSRLWVKALHTPSRLVDGVNDIKFL